MNHTGALQAGQVQISDPSTPPDRPVCRRAQPLDPASVPLVGKIKESIFVKKLFLICPLTNGTGNNGETPDTQLPSAQLCCSLAQAGGI